MLATFDVKQTILDIFKPHQKPRVAIVASQFSLTTKYFTRPKQIFNVLWNPT